MPDDQHTPGQVPPDGQPSQPSQPPWHSAQGQPGQGQQPGGPGYGQPPYNAPPYGPPRAQPVSPTDERTWSTLGHVGGIVLGFLAPLVVYLVYKDRSVFLRRHSAEALNFQITMVIAYLAGVVLLFVIIGVFVLVAAWVLTIVYAIIAAVAASRGQEYRYPLTIRFVH